MKTLSDDEVAELEARPTTTMGGYRRVLLRPSERDALCQTVRALRGERLEIQRVLASAVLEDPIEDDQPPCSTTELVEGVCWLLRMKEMKQERNTALREQLAQETERADSNFTAYDRIKTKYSETVNQLAQVTQEPLAATIDILERRRRQLGSQSIPEYARTINFIQAIIDEKKKEYPPLRAAGSKHEP